MPEPNRGGHLRSRLPSQGQEDEQDRCPEAFEDGAREGGVPDHLVEGDQHASHLATPKRRHRARDRRRLKHGQNLHR